MAAQERVDGRDVGDPQLGPVPGLAQEPDPSERRRTDIRVFDFGSQYLPLPYAPRIFEAEGDWRFDPNSMVVVNGKDRPQDLRQLSYSVESVDIDPDPDELSDAAVDWVIDGYTHGRVADEQMSALLMAIYLRGMKPAEISRWTAAMIASRSDSSSSMGCRSVRRPSCS